MIRCFGVTIRQKAKRTKKRKSRASYELKKCTQHLHKELFEHYLENSRDHCLIPTEVGGIKKFLRDSFMARDRHTSVDIK